MYNFIFFKKKIQCPAKLHKWMNLQKKNIKLHAQIRHLLLKLIKSQKLVAKHGLNRDDVLEFRIKVYIYNFKGLYKLRLTNTPLIHSTSCSHLFFMSSPSFSTLSAVDFYYNIKMEIRLRNLNIFSWVLGQKFKKFSLFLIVSFF